MGGRVGILSWVAENQHKGLHVLMLPSHLNSSFYPSHSILVGTLNWLALLCPSDLSLLSKLQVGVLNWFAKLWEIDAEEYWGYITTCGTEGNLHGILTGRENLPDGILYASQVSKYGVRFCSTPGRYRRFTA